MPVVKSRKFDSALAAELVLDIQYALAGVALKHKVDLIVGETPKITDGEVFLGLQAKMIRPHAPEVVGDDSDGVPTDRIAGFIAALADGHAKHFPHLSLKQHYRNGEHTYAIVGFNARARQHKLLMQNVDNGEYSRMPIDVVSEYKRVRAKKA